MAGEIERDILNIKGARVYALPPAKTVRAADWKLDDPMWTGELVLSETLADDDSGGSRLFLRLIDLATRELFAEAPYEGPYCLEPATDSSRCFVLRLVDGARKAFVGLGLDDRSDAFDLVEALQKYSRQRDPRPASTGMGPMGKVPTGMTAVGVEPRGMTPIRVKSKGVAAMKVGSEKIASRMVDSKAVPPESVGFKVLDREVERNQADIAGPTPHTSSDEDEDFGDFVSST